MLQNYYRIEDKKRKALVVAHSDVRRSGVCTATYCIMRYKNSLAMSSTPVQVF